MFFTQHRNRFNKNPRNAKRWNLLLLKTDVLRWCDNKNYYENQMFLLPRRRKRSFLKKAIIPGVFYFRTLRTWYQVCKNILMGNPWWNFFCKDDTIEIKMRYATAFILVGFSWFRCRLKAEIASFSTTPKSAQADQYKCRCGPHFDFNVILKMWCNR